MSQQFIDILITGRDLTLDPAGMPENVDNRASIAQDIKHMIIESGLLVQLVAERSPMKWASNLILLEQMVEDDLRIIPGSVIIERDKNDAGRVFLFANTTLGPLNWSLMSDTVEASLP